MEYKRTMYLLSLLHSAAEGAKKERIGDLFKNAVTSTDEYQQLKKLLHSVTFLGFDGAAKHDESEAALQNTISDIVNSTENIKRLQLLISQIENELKKADRLLGEVGFFDEDFIAVQSKKVDLYGKFYKELANMICYYLISQFGVKSIRNLTFNHKAGFQETTKLVNQQYGNELFMSYHSKKPLTWKISRQSFNSDNVICYQGVKIEYDDTPISDVLQKVKEEEYYRIAPFVFAATSPSVPAQYIGFGNIIGVDILRGLSLLDSEIATSLPVTAFSSSFETTDLIGAIKRALNTESFCISPEDVVAAMNRQKLNDTVASRRREGKCVICGRSVNGRTACKDHLSISHQ